MDQAKLDTMHKWLVLVAFLTLIDQLSKRVAEIYLQFAEPVPIIPWFNFMLVYNEGAAFSFLSQAGGWQRWFFIVTACAVCAYICNWLRKLKNTELLLGTSLCLVLSGALGNLIDRIVYGKVADFIDFYYPAKDECIYFFFYLLHNGCHWPTFNIADILITTGAILLLIQMLGENSSDDANPN